VILRASFPVPAAASNNAHQITRGYYNTASIGFTVTPKIHPAAPAAIPGILVTVSGVGFAAVRPTSLSLLTVLRLVLHHSRCYRSWNRFDYHPAVASGSYQSGLTEILRLSPPYRQLISLHGRRSYFVKRASATVGTSITVTARDFRPSETGITVTFDEHLSPRRALPVLQGMDVYLHCAGHCRRFTCD